MTNDAQPVDNPFGVMQFIKQADELTMSILVILVLMSLACWFVILTKLWDQRRIEKSYAETQKKFWNSGNLHEGMNALTGRDNVFRMIAEDGLRAAQYHKGPYRWVELDAGHWLIQERFEDVSREILAHLEANRAG